MEQIIKFSILIKDFLIPLLIGSKVFFSLIVAPNTFKTLKSKNMSFLDYAKNLQETSLSSAGYNLKDLDNNSYYLKTINLNLDNYDFSGEELYIDFDNSLFGNKENEPRLTGKKISDNKNESTIQKGTFTTCKKNEENCPPWLLSADEIKHKKKEKII